MNEKTTLYLEPDLKQAVKIKLIKDYDNKSMSALVNELLKIWLQEQND